MKGSHLRRFATEDRWLALEDGRAQSRARPKGGDLWSLPLRLPVPVRRRNGNFTEAAPLRSQHRNLTKGLSSHHSLGEGND